MKRPHVYDAFDRPIDEGSDVGGVSLTQQQYAQECDINYIMERMGQGEVVNVDVMNEREAIYGDVSEIGDFHEVEEKLRLARESFDALPGKLRARFAHDPGNLLDFLEDDSNRAEAEALGIVSKREEVPPAPAGDGHTPAT